jgi:hypothetical protein
MTVFYIEGIFCLGSKFMPFALFGSWMEVFVLIFWITFRRCFKIKTQCSDFKSVLKKNDFDAVFVLEKAIFFSITGKRF